MQRALDETDQRLLDEWQRDFPLCSYPFARIGEALGIGENEVLSRMKDLIGRGMISRIGGTIVPNIVSASTLAAVAVPDARIEEVAALVSRISGINHSYLRENHWNLWFVATGPDRAHVDETLARIEAESGLMVLDLPLVRPFNIDLGFRLSGGLAGQGVRPAPADPAPDPARIRLLEGDRAILQALSTGLEPVARPYDALARRLGREEADVIGRIKAHLDMGVITRLGVIVRHRALGWRANAMVVWDLAPGITADIGPRLAAVPGVTLCYERRPVEGVWPYRLYNMIHGRSRDEALGVLEEARAAIPELTAAPHAVLFSTRCFKQTGALIKPMKEAAE